MVFHIFSFNSFSLNALGFIFDSVYLFRHELLLKFIIFLYLPDSMLNLFKFDMAFDVRIYENGRGCKGVLIFGVKIELNEGS